MNELLDMVIIGSGPAGLAAAVYAARAELTFTVIERSDVSGGQVLSTYEVDNYPGLPARSGPDIASSMRAHCDSLGVDFTTAEVLRLQKDDYGIFLVELDNGSVLRAKTVIAATGAAHRLLGCKGEEELAGCGVSYCATCDGAFFKNAEVAVVGGGDVAVEDAIYLARMCKKVYLIHRRDEFRAAKTLVTKARELDNIEFVLDSVVDEILGEDMVTGVLVHNVETKAATKLDVAGVFVAVGIVPESAIFTDGIEKDESGYIVADETCETSLPGFFAAGDVRTKALRQIITAAADGANAVTAAEKYMR